MKHILLFFSLLTLPLTLSFAQSYTSYFTGNPNDTLTQPFGGACIMGGATEHDEAMKRFLQYANGGDVLVLRASGADGYNTYLYSQLGIPVNSVETIKCNSAAASADPYVLQKIQQAEAIWFAGGDQWNYISYWRGTAVDSLVRIAIADRHVVVGGTSAGMAILGEYYFSAQNGTVQSSTALANPFDSNVTVDSARFIQAPFLDRVITDTHYDNPDRRGRHVVFLARIAQAYGLPAHGIACDEYTAVFIDTTGLAHVYGDFPNNDDNAYFIQTNCELPNPQAETCQANTPLSWVRDSMALRVYQIKGTNAGNKYFNLNDWKTGAGGTWRQWYVVDGVLNDDPGPIPGACDTTSTGLVKGVSSNTLRLIPNPSSNGQVRIEGLPDFAATIELLDLQGRVLYRGNANPGMQGRFSFPELPAGMYLVRASAGMVVRTGRMEVILH